MILIDLPLNEQAHLNELVGDCRERLLDNDATTTSITTRYLQNKIIIIGTLPSGHLDGYEVSYGYALLLITGVHHFKTCH